MPLDTQVKIYSVDTGSFYSNRENRLHQLIYKFAKEKNIILSQISRLEKEILKFVAADINKNDFLDDERLKSIISEYRHSQDKYKMELVDYLEKYLYLQELLPMKSSKIKATKGTLSTLLKNKRSANLNSNGNHYRRKLRPEALSDKNVIAIFDSALTRMIGIEKDELSTEFMVVQVYYFDIIADLIYYGFEYNGERYIYFTSSAGQIRTKKTVFIKESTWKRIEKTVMCGLSLDRINKLGGNNPNKHLAYMALTNSATDIWEEFDIDKSIVIDDFETEVHGTYDLVDDETYSITRTTGKIPIPHTDGAGMMLPHMGRNRMVRLPWIKGLLGAFDFKKFIEEHNCSPIIKDIYGEEHDIIAEEIEVIFTKSQFKLWKYYSSWGEYKKYFKQYGCTAGYANIEGDIIKSSSINYQMLQTLTDITDDELKQIAAPSIDRVLNLTKSVENIKSAFGVTVFNRDKTYFQKAIDIYPNLLNDLFIKNTLRSIKDSMVKRYKAGKLDISGKYTFVFPDFYAACEHWFLHKDNPSGLLNDGEVYCDLFRAADEVDCLRSPHLFKEHAIRKNIACRKNGERRENISKWFTTNAIYTSCHDLISRVLQFDVDGDMLLVVADKTMIEVAKRNMEEIVPLYYNMKKSKSSPLTYESIYNGLHASFAGKDIGIYSNDISKIWNDDIFQIGTDIEKNEVIDIVRILCMENNYCIDHAKTLYMPERPEFIQKLISKYSNNPLPYFFTYAKDKKPFQVVPKNGSIVNRLDDIIPNPRLNFRKIGLEEINWKMLISNPNVKCKVKFHSNGRIDVDNTESLILKYNEWAEKLKYQTDLAWKQKEGIIRQIRYSLPGRNNQLVERIAYSDIITKIKQDFFLACSEDDTVIADKLVKYLYHINDGHKGKRIFWLCYGDIVYDTLHRNVSMLRTINGEKSLKQIEKKILRCSNCGEWFEAPKTSNFVACNLCRKRKKEIICNA